jgi:hypothetical protein
MGNTGGGRAPVVRVLLAGRGSLCPPFYLAGIRAALQQVELLLSSNEEQKLNFTVKTRAFGKEFHCCVLHDFWNAETTFFTPLLGGHGTLSNMATVFVNFIQGKQAYHVLTITVIDFPPSPIINLSGLRFL